MIKTGFVILSVLLSLSSVAANRINTSWSKDTVCIQGKVKDFPKSGGNGLLYINNAINKSGFPVVVELDSMGHFSASFPLPYAQRTYMVLNERFIPIYLKSCDTIHIYIQWTKNEDTPLTIKYAGKDALINQELLQARSIEFKKIPFPENDGIANDSVRMDYHTKVQEAYQEYVAGLVRICKQQHFLPETQKLLLDEALLSLAEQVIYYDNVSYMTKVNPVIKDPVADPYYSFLKQIPWNDFSLLSAAVFPRFIELFDYSSILHKKWKIQDNPEILFRILDEANIKLTEEEKTLRSDVKRASDKLEALEKKYQDSALFSIAQQLVFRKFVYHEKMHLKQGIIWEISDFRLVKNHLDLLPDRSAALEAVPVMQKSLRDSGLRSMVKEAVDKAFPENIAQTENNFILPEGRVSDVFRRITEPYKGKVLLVDVWATWCSPCLAGIESMQPLREKYSGQDIVFIFISSEKNSPMTAFNRIMDNVEGVKYRLGEDDYNYFCQLFKINTIPRYILVGRSGKIMDADYKLKEIESTLDKLLK